MPMELHPRRGDPAWVVARLYPSQGDWTEQAFLSLPDNRGLELRDGVLEALPVPKRIHQRIIRFLVRLLEAYLDVHPAGELFVTGFKARIRPGVMREPDLMVVLDRHKAFAGEDYADKADLAIEVVSPDDPARDYVAKREDYAAAGISEYWVVDPIKRVITVLTLRDGDAYHEHGVFREGQTATSIVLPGFAADVTTTLTAYAD